MLARLILLLLCVSVSSSRAEVLLHGKAARLGVPHQGPFVRAGDNAIWSMDERGALVSRDEGRTWAPRAIFDAAVFAARKERALLRTREGVMLYAFLNERERVFKWDDNQGGPLEGCRLPVYVSRSADDGATWSAPFLLQEGWCGAVRQMIQLKSGRIALVSQVAKANPGRHVTIVYVSDDLGKTWLAGDAIDFGDRGNYGGKVAGLTGSTHGGGIEATVLEQQNGDLKLLLRVPHGHFEEMISRDGLKWGSSRPSTLEASDSPGMMVRLASGRVALLWNRYADPVQKLGRREELSLAFSENDGVTWTVPQVIALNRVPAGAREGAYWISYPYLFEATPGRLWISTMQGDVRAGLAERDFLVPTEPALDGTTARVLMLGDSITRGARPGVTPQAAFSALTQAALREAGVRAQVHNVGIGSERTDLALARLERDVVSQRPAVVAVMYGTNDSWVDAGKTSSRLGEAAFGANLREIVKRLRAGGAKVVLMTAPKFAEKSRRNGLDEDPNLRLAHYMVVTRAVAAETGCVLVDHFAGWDVAQRDGRVLQEWTTDGLHPNAAGHADIAGRIAPALLPLLR
jgi:lysophospholipase L1-like esterase